MKSLFFRGAFERQFTPADGGYLYRAAETGPAYLVSVEEYARFQEEYRATLQERLWVYLPGLVPVAAIAIYFSGRVPEALSLTFVTWSFPLSPGALIVRVLANAYDILAPQRALAGRRPVAPE